MTTYAAPKGQMLVATMGQDGYDQTDPGAQQFWVTVPDGTEALSTTATVREKDESLQDWANRVSKLSAKDGGWINPPAPEPQTTNMVNIIAWKMRFTPDQIVAIRASDDSVVKVFLSELVDDPRTLGVNVTDAFVINGVEYLASLKLIGADDIARILAPAPV